MKTHFAGKFVLRSWIPRALIFVAIVCALLSPASSLAGQQGKPKDRSAEAKVDRTESDAQDKEKAKEASKSEEVAQSKEQTESREPTLAIVGATVHTLGAQGTLKDATILISGDTIIEVSTSAKVPADVKTIKADGLTLAPGLIDASSRLWLTSSAASSTASDASLNVLDGIDPFDEQWHEVIRHGVTTVYVQPGERGALSGYGAVVSVVPGEEGPEVHKSLAAIQASIGIGASTNQSRKQQVDRTIKLLKDAKQYQDKWDKYNAYLKKQEEAKKAAAKKDAKAKSGDKSKDGKNAEDGKKATEKSTKSGPTDPRAAAIARLRMRRMAEAAKKAGGKPADASKTDGKTEKSAKDEKPPEKPDVDEAKARLAKVVSGKIPIRLAINTSDDAHYARLLLKEFEDLQVVLTGLTDLRSAKEKVRDLNLPVVLGPWLELEANYSDDPDSSHEWAELFADYDGALVISSSGTTSRSSRLLRAHVGRAIAAGVAPETALRAVTINAARVLGVDAKIGSIEAGKRADIVGFHGDPTDASAPVSLVVSGGQIQLDESQGEAQSEVASKTEPNADDGWGLLDRPLPKRFAIRTSNYLGSDGSTAPRTLVVDTENGTIQELASGDEQNEGLPSVDVGDAWVTPGLTSSHASLGLSRLVDPRLSDATYVVAGDGATPGFEGETELVESGLLRALLSPSSRNTLSGCSSVIRLGATEQVVERVAAVKFTMSGDARSADRFPSSLAGQSQLIRESLAGKLLDTRLYIPEPVQKRLTNERRSLLEAVGQGKTLALIHASTDADIRAALDLIEEKKLTAWLFGAEQLEPFIQRLKALEVGVVARPVRVADYDWYAKDLADASNAGIPIYFAGENAEQLRLTAALAVESGMDPEKALAGICYSLLTRTENDAKQSADLVIWSRSPLNLAARPLCVLVDGEVKLIDANAASDSKGVDK